MAASTGPNSEKRSGVRSEHEDINGDNDGDNDDNINDIILTSV